MHNTPQASEAKKKELCVNNQFNFALENDQAGRARGERNC